MWVARSGKSLTFSGTEFELQCQSCKVGNLQVQSGGKNLFVYQHPAGEANNMCPRPSFLIPSPLLPVSIRWVSAPERGAFGSGCLLSSSLIQHTHTGLPGSRYLEEEPCQPCVTPQPLLNSNRCLNQTMRSQRASWCVISKHGATTKPKPKKQPRQ